MMAAAAGDSCPLGVRAQGSSTQLLPVLRVLHCTDGQMVRRRRPHALTVHGT